MSDAGWPRTPTEQRRARAQIAGQIAARRIAPTAARAINETTGWAIETPGGETIAYRWGKGAGWIVARMVEQIIGREWAD